MSFISKLTEDKVIDLINYCLEKNGESLETEITPIDQIKLLAYGPIKNEDEFSVVVQTFRNGTVQEAYHIDDYSMTDYFYEMKDHPEVTDYSKWHKIYMAKTFGMQYLNELYALRRNQLDAELLEITDALEHNRI